MSFLSHPFLAQATTVEEGLPKAPVAIWRVGGFEINNSMISALIASAIVIIAVQTAMAKPKLVPTGLQNFIEWIVESLSGFIESITGRETMRRGFWFFASLFVVIFAENFFALLPGTGTFGYGHGKGFFDWGFKVTHPFLRGANAEASMTAAYSAIFFVMWFYWTFRALGTSGVFKDIFASKVKFGNIGLDITFGLLFFVVGLLEVLTILFIRPVAFTFRLYGNIFGGEMFLDTIYRNAPNHFLATLFLIPAYMWEFVVAFIQAFVFFILTVVFTGILTNAHANSPEHKDGH